eukprot:gene22780-biopygen16279
MGEGPEFLDGTVIICGNCNAKPAAPQVPSYSIVRYCSAHRAIALEPGSVRPGDQAAHWPTDQTIRTASCGSVPRKCNSMYSSRRRPGAVGIQENTHWEAKNWEWYHKRRKIRGDMGNGGAAGAARDKK